MQLLTIVLKVAACCHLAMALLSPLSWSQDITKGSISGVVKDASGAVVAGAPVKLTSPFGDRSTTTNAGGEYSFLNLVIGPGYDVTVAANGFAPAEAKDPDRRHEPAGPPRL